MNNTEKLIARLNELSNAVTKGKEAIDREFYMSIPARPDHDADLVLSDAAMKIAELTKERDDAIERIAWVVERVNVEEGNVSLPMYKKNSFEILETLKELNKAVDGDSDE